jgi:hypothetical protein
MPESIDPEIEKLEKNIKLFLEVYKILSPAGRAAFEAQINAAMQKGDEKTKRLYKALLRAAKEGMNQEQALDEMKKAKEEKAS